MKTVFHKASEPIKKLNHLKFFIPGSKPILAGGALRDDYMGRPERINDYDIFIKDFSELFNNKEETADVIEKIIHKVFPRAEDAVELFDSEYMTLDAQHEEHDDVKPGPHDQIVSVWEVDEDYVTYQLVFTKGDPIEHVNKYFDIGFCKAYCDGTKIRYTDDFLYDVKHKTLTIVGDGMSKDQVEYAIFHHADRLQWRYSGFRVVVPPRYQKFVEVHGFPTS